MTSFQSGQFVKMLIGKLLCGIGRVHLEPAARLCFCSTPKSLIKNHKTPACAQWSSYLGCADMGEVKCVRFNSWWTGTNNGKFHYLGAKGLSVVIVVKVKSKNWLPVLWMKVWGLTEHPHTNSDRNLKGLQWNSCLEIEYVVAPLLQWISLCPNLFPWSDLSSINKTSLGYSHFNEFIKFCRSN